MSRKRVLIFVVAYNAERFIASVISRIPESLLQDERLELEVLVIDDSSKDETFQRGHEFRQTYTHCPITLLKNPKNLGYGGNQKLGYRYAIDNKFDYVVLLHGDGQYAPEELPKLLAPLLNDQADAVFGSRMLTSFGALKGGMPMYKFIGNRILTTLQNWLVGTRLSEWHSGYRLYSCAALKRIPFESNSNNFDFDTDIIVQLHDARMRIAELPIPTYYGDEICHVNGVSYGLKILLSCFMYRIQRLSIFYNPKFDTGQANEQYEVKFDFVSSHSLALNAVQQQDELLILGCGPLETVTPYFAKTNGAVSVIDQYVGDDLRHRSKQALAVDLDQFRLSDGAVAGEFSKVLALDIVEHLKSPEAFLEDIRNAPATRESLLVLTTPNIAFCLIRASLLLGAFNYGKRGILDRTHTRLFTFRSLRRLFEQSGYQVEKMRGIPVPFPLAVGRNVLGEFLLSLNELAIKILPTVFSYQIYVEARPLPTTELLLERAHVNTRELEQKLKVSSS
ncbi:MAG: glycosyltransferase [Deltaproteobacteria bacterium]|nr:glycosyltransferase [Deltaproteobacteria bacterium]